MASSPNSAIEDLINPSVNNIIWDEDPAYPVNPKQENLLQNLAQILQTRLNEILYVEQEVCNTKKGMEHGESKRAVTAIKSSKNNAFCQFAFTEYFDYTLNETVNEIQCKMIKSKSGLTGAKPKDGRTVHAEARLIPELCEINSSIKFAGTKIALIYTHLFPCTDPRKNECSCFDKIKEFAENKGEGYAVIVMYSKPWPVKKGQTEQKCNTERKAKMKEVGLPKNIAFVRVDLKIDEQECQKLDGHSEVKDKKGKNVFVKNRFVNVTNVELTYPESSSRKRVRALEAATKLLKIS
ncbi:unnamed protein product [Meganyctiphanes norvegica]|uniref:APOBEC-like N-terminal domain-containing protein n=1 Tax=Meganyctiphanes norvegica TaxID=48144 RepID=A0AAV2PL39_MEGNR